MSRSKKVTAGSKGTNAPFQFSVLKGLQGVADNTSGIGGTLLSILNSVRAHQDMEILLVRDNGVMGTPIIQQIREYDETTDSWSTSYTNISGVAYTPVGPLEYLDSSAVLNLILAELVTQTSLLTNIDDVTSGTLEVPRTVEEVYVAGVNETGSTLSGVKSFSIMFEGTGGKLNGVTVHSGYVNSKPASLGNGLDSEPFTIPTAGDVKYPTPRVLISYVV